MPQQFKNPANPEIHRKTTAEEIWRDTDGKVDILVSGVGTGGTITGVGEVHQGAQAVASSASPSSRTPRPVLTRRRSKGPHPIQGIGAGFIPDVLNTEDHRRGHPGEERRRLRDGPPAGEGGRAAVRHLARARRSGPRSQVAQRPENAGKLIVVIMPSFGERYLAGRLDFSTVLLSRQSLPNSKSRLRLAPLSIRSRSQPYCFFFNCQPSPVPRPSLL